MSAPVTFIKKPPQAICSLRRHGGDEEDRTLDLTDANRTLSQLSYAPISDDFKHSFFSARLY